MKQQHHPKDVRTFSRGANYDINKEFLVGDKGTYINACNMRPTDMSRDNGALKKIKGETLTYDGGTSLTPCADVLGVLALALGQECIGTIEVNNHIVEFWAYRISALGDSINHPSKYPSIMIDGVIVAQSEDIPFSVDFPLQMDKNEACSGGEVYVTDNNVPPMFFNIEDLLVNSGFYSEDDCTLKYYSEFDVDLNIISLKTTINAPRFVQIRTSNSGDYDAVNSGNGLDVGSYAYAVRFVDSSGNRTELSEFTPTIPIFKSVSSRTRIHPWAYTFGATAGGTSSQGLEILIRADQTKGYEKCEVIRVNWTSGNPVLLNAPPVANVVGIFDLDPNHIREYRFLDRDNGIIEGISDEESTLVQTSVTRAKAIRFFENTLYLMNISLTGKDVSAENIGSLPDTSQVNAYPVMRHINFAGHRDPWQHTYMKSYMNNERYGFGIVFRDANGSKVFTQSLKFDQGGGLKDFFQFPRKRESLSSESINVSYSGANYSCNDNNTIGWTHDSHDLAYRERKSQSCHWIQYLEDGGKCVSRVDKGALWSRCAQYDSDDWYQNYTTCIGGKFKTRNLYGVLHPTHLGDSTLADSSIGHHYQPLQHYWTDNNTKVYTQDINSSGETATNNYMYKPNYFSMGLAIEKINPPSWATSFSIVRTESALRVQAQGICFYNLTKAYKNKRDTEKSKTSVAFYSKDIDVNQGLLAHLATDIEDFPNEYELHLEAPIGFNTEIYDANRSSGKDEALDMLTVAWMQKDYKSGASNPKWYLEGDNSPVPLGDSTYRYVTFGRWRNTIAGTVWAGKRVFKITGADYIQGSGTTAGDRGAHYWEISVDDTIYSSITAGANHHMNEPNTKNFHEPLYMASIVRDTNEPKSGSNVDYITTGHMQQLKSPIYMSRGIEFETPLVDERWEDCVADSPYIGNGDGTANSNGSSRISGQTKLYYQYRRFIYETLDGSGAIRPWVNITGFDAAEIDSILTSIATTGSAQVATIEGGGVTKTVYGVYTNRWEGSTHDAETTYLVFSGAYITSKGLNPLAYKKESYIPAKGSVMVVHYDNRIPIRVFGGDTFHSEELFAMADLQFGSDNKPVGGREGINDFKINTGMPYGEAVLNERNIIVNNTGNGLTNNIQDHNKVKMASTVFNGAPAYIRQWMILFIGSTRSPAHTKYMFLDSRDDVGGFYPLLHHRPRPHKWNTDDALGAQRNVKQAYYDDLGQEDKWWNYGGFKFLSAINNDYAAQNTFHAYTTKPQTFEEELDFCTRIIWSEPKPVNIQDSPNIRSFPALNFFDISDDTGEIKYAYDTEGTRGNNLYAVTDSGVCLLLTNKKMINELAGGELATIGSESLGVLKQIWLDKHIGMPDEMWRAAAESRVALYFANKDSVFKLLNDTITDIGRVKYHYPITNALKGIEDGYGTKLTGVYNKLHNEYWLNINCVSDAFDGFWYGTWKPLVFPPESLKPAVPFQLVDVENNGGEVFPTAEMGYLGNVGVPDNGKLMMYAPDGGDITLGKGGNGTQLSAGNSFMLCLTADSQAINVIDPVNEETHVVEPATCKCLERRLLLESSDEIPQVLKSKWQLTTEGIYNGEGAGCRIRVTLENLNAAAFTSALAGTPDASSADFTIQWSCSNCTPDQLVYMNINSNGVNGWITVPYLFIAIIEVKIYDINGNLVDTIYSSASGCNPDGGSGGVTGEVGSLSEFSKKK